MLGDNLRGALFMTISMATFTINDACVKWLAQGLPEFQVIALRGVAASGLIAMLAWRMGVFAQPIPPEDRLPVAGRVLAEMGILVPFIIALVHMPLANVIAILQAVPLVLTAVGALVFRESVGWRRWLAILLGLLGVLLIVKPGTDGFNLYSLYALGAVGLITLRDVMTRRISARTPSLKVTVFTASGVTALGFALSAGTPWEMPNPQEAGVMLLAAGMILVSYLFSIMAMRIGEIGVVTPFRYTAILWGVLMGVLVFGDIPGLLTLVGATLVVGAGLYTLWRERRTGPPRAAGAPDPSSGSGA